MTSGRIPVNSLVRHVAPLRAALSACLDEVVGSGHFVLGPGVAAFEEAFARACGVDHCVGVGNGTDALHLALLALGVGRGDRVVVTANAGMYATGAVISIGAEPVFVDVLEDEATMDPASLEAVLGAVHGGHPRIAAVVVTHLFGRLARMDALLPGCRTRGVAVLEDCAQAHGARDATGRVAGAFGDAASFSFYPTKNLGALGDGGAVTTADGAIAARLRALRQYGWERKYVCTVPDGRNTRLDELQARVLSLLLPRLDAWNQRRRDIAARYAAGIRHPDILLPTAAGAAHVAHLQVVRSPRRDALRAHLDAAGIDSDVHYPVPDHRQPCHGDRHAGVVLPVTERLAATVLTLPCFPELEDHEVDRVVDACNRF